MKKTMLLPKLTRGILFVFLPVWLGAQVPVCNDFVQLSLDGNCEALVLPDMVLEGSYPNFDDFTVRITRLDGTPVPNPVTGAYIGEPLQYKVTHEPTQNSCWGMLVVEDKLAPVLVCADATLPCHADPEPAWPAWHPNHPGGDAPFPEILENCTPLEDLTVNLVSEVVDDAQQCADPQPGDGSAGSVTIVRQWVAVDAAGNESALCTQTITIVRPENIDFPNDIVWTCEQSNAFPNVLDPTPLHPFITDTDPGTPQIIEVNLDPESDDDDGSLPFPPPNDTKDRPDINSTNIANGGNGSPGDTPPNNGLDDADVLELTGSGTPARIDGPYCQYGYVHFDVVTNTCTGAQGLIKITRTWTVLDWCTGQVILSGFDDRNGNGIQDPGEVNEDNVQIIEVIDDKPPVLFASDLTLGTNIPGQHPQPCRSREKIPFPPLVDNCSGVPASNRKIFTPIGETSSNGTIPFPGLEPGTYTITYQATDRCGNVATATANLTIVDDDIPIAVCDEITEVNLSSDGLAEVEASVFDDGSYDNCCFDRMEVRRMSDPCGIPGNTAFGPSVTFCCADAGTAVQVVLRVYDCSGNYNECMVQVIVNDKQTPVLVDCPGPRSITCDFYWENLEADLDLCAGDPRCMDEVLSAHGFGDAQFVDNCDLEPEVNVFVNVDQCGEGTITRTWVATDPAGNSATPCSQVIQVSHVSDWAVEFPDDLEFDCGTDPGTIYDAIGEPTLFRESCELIAVSYEDELFDVVQDACFKLVRHWTVINWCVVGEEVDDEVVENSEAEIVHTLNGCTLPLPPLPQQGCVFFPPLRPEADLNFDGDHTAEPGDLVPNDRRTFQDGLTAANFTGVGALRGAQPDGFITYQQVVKVVDETAPILTCAPPKFPITDNSCSATVEIPLPTIEDCVGAQNVTVSVESDLGQGFGPFDDVPPGEYLVRYTAMDNCGNSSACETTLEVLDKKKPTPVCKNGIVVAIMPSNPPMVEIWASDFNDGSFDNCTPAEELIFSFSQDTTDRSILLDCDDLQSQPQVTIIVELWVTDAAGNQDFCETFVILQDLDQSCGDPLVVLGGTVHTETDEPVEGVTLTLNGTDPQTTDAAGAYTFAGLQLGADYSIVPHRDDDPLNGVTTFDLVLITRHILGVEALDSPYKIIAADANRSGSVTTFDLVQLRRLILFIDEEFPQNTSWRFIDRDFTFPDPAQPFSTPFPELINYNNLAASDLEADFVAVKVGDVNGSAQPSLSGSLEERGLRELSLRAAIPPLHAGEVVRVPLVAPTDVRLSALQFTLEYDPHSLAFRGLQPQALAEGQPAWHEHEGGRLTFAWNAEETAALGGTPLMTLEFEVLQETRADEALRLSSHLTPALAYDSEGNAFSLHLAPSFSGQTALVLSGARPNPFRSAAAIHFYLPRAGTIHFSLLDATGRILFQTRQALDAGAGRIELPETATPGPGVYFYRLEFEGTVRSGKLVRL